MCIAVTYTDKYDDGIRNNQEAFFITSGRVCWLDGEANRSHACVLYSVMQVSLSHRQSHDDELASVSLFASLVVVGQAQGL